MHTRNNTSGFWLLLLLHAIHSVLSWIYITRNGMRLEFEFITILLFIFQSLKAKSGSHLISLFHKSTFYEYFQVLLIIFIWHSNKNIIFQLWTRNFSLILNSAFFLSWISGKTYWSGIKISQICVHS